MPCSSLRVLQCGFPKSGNYGAYRLLAALLEAAGGVRSHKRRVGLAAVADAFCADTLVFPEASHVDSFSFASGGCALEFPHPDCRWLPVEPALLMDASNLLWTHDPCDVVLRPELAAVSHCVYVLRDGRDVLDSLLHHVVRPEIRRLNPEYRHATVDAVYADTALFARYARRWAEHVASWLRHRRRFLVIRLEELAEDPVAVAAETAAALGLDVDAEAIGERVSTAELRRAAPGHLRRGVGGGWRDRFGAEHLRLFEACAGEVLASAGYARDARLC